MEIIVTKSDVARAIATVSPQAGQQCDCAHPQSVEQRAKNLLRPRKYGAYIQKGNPHGWGGKAALVTLYLEQQGGAEDCCPPLDYYEDGFDVAARASELLKGCCIEFVNAAVAAVYRL